MGMVGKTISGLTIAQIRKELKAEEAARTAAFGPRVGGSTSGRVLNGSIFKVDFAPVMKDLHAALAAYSDEVGRVALVHAINRGCAPLLTAVRREVAAQTSMKANRVASRIIGTKAHPNRLEFRIDAIDKATTLSEFKVSGQPGKTPRVTVWNKTKSYKGAFIVVTRRGERVPMKRHAGKLYPLMGPIIPVEMLRKDSRSIRQIERAIPDRVIARLPHELDQAAQRAARRSRTS